MFQFLHGTITRATFLKTKHCFIAFQFLHGTITRVIDASKAEGASPFQFLHGTITRCNTGQVSCRGRRVSIPSWYNYKSQVALIKTQKIGCFNSFMVQLQAYFLHLSRPLLIGFNSFMVQLQVFFVPFCNITNFSFNSFMVQLQAVIIVRKILNEIKFQFLHGTITRLQAGG